MGGDSAEDTAVEAREEVMAVVACVVEAGNFKKERVSVG